MVVVTFPMTQSALGALKGALGPDLDVLDVRVAPADCDLVVCRPCSPGAIRSLKRTFPAAKIVVVASPGSCGSDDLAGPVSRMRAAGADLYMTGTSARLLTAAIRDRVGPAAVGATLVSHRRLAA